MVKVDLFSKNYLITFRTYLLIFVIFAIAASLSFYDFLILSSNTFKIFIFSLSTSAFSVALLFIFEKIFLGKRFSLLNAIWVFTIVGLIRGAVIYFAIPLTQLANPVPLTYRLFNSAVTSVIWLLVFIKIDSLRLRFQKKIEGLISQALINQISNLSDKDLENELLNISNKLKSTQIDIKQGLIESEKFILAAQEVKRQIEEAIRPLSHRLWLDNKKNLPRVNSINVIRESLKQLSYNPQAVIFLYFLTTFINLNAYFETQISFLISFFASIILLLTHFIYVILKLEQRKNTLINIFYLAAASWTSFYVTMQFYPESISIWPTYIKIVSLLIFPTMAIIFSVFRLLEQDRRFLTNLIENRLNLNPSTKAKEFEKAQVASYLHNRLQAELLNAARQLELSALDPNSHESRRNLENLGSLINRSISEDFKESYLNPREKLDEIIKGWRGIVDISLSLDESILQDPRKTRLISQVIQEAASNTVKHSNSRELVINIEQKTNQNLQIMVKFELMNNQLSALDISKGWLSGISLITPMVIDDEKTKTIIIEI